MKHRFCFYKKENVLPLTLCHGMLGKSPPPISSQTKAFVIFRTRHSPSWGNFTSQSHLLAAYRNSHIVCQHLLFICLFSLFIVCAQIFAFMCAVPGRTGESMRSPGTRVTVSGKPPVGTGNQSWVLRLRSQCASLWSNLDSLLSPVES